MQLTIEDWRRVITLWGDDAARVVALTGNQLPANARVLLLDVAGQVVWFADRGYSAGGLVDLDQRARELLPPSAPEAPPSDAPSTFADDPS